MRFFPPFLVGLVALAAVSQAALLPAAKAPPTCLDALLAHLNRCEPLVCDSHDPRLDGRQARVQVFGRQNGLCLATAQVPAVGTLHCQFAPSTVRYLLHPGVQQALRSQDLETSVRAPESRDDIVDALEGHPLLSVSYHEHPLDTSGIQHDCTVSLR